MVIMIKYKAHDGHDNHNEHNNHGEHDNHIEEFKHKFFISLFLGIPVLFLSPMMGITLPFQFYFKGSEWIVLFLSTVLYFYGGSPFLKGAKDELKEENPTMMTLISLGISVSYFYSVYAFIANEFLNNSNVMNFFWELASLILIMLRYLSQVMNLVLKAQNDNC